MAMRSLAAIRRVERQRLHSIPANAVAVAASPEIAVSPVIVEPDRQQAPAEQRQDNSILKLNR
jgi:hypothetical protein